MSATPSGNRIGLYLAVAASVVVVATVCAAIAVMGTPAQQRLARLDEARIDDLQELAQAVRHQARVAGALPASLQVFAEERGSSLRLADRVTGARYGYMVKDKGVFALCATFDTDTSQVRLADRRWRGNAHEWDHPAGRHCFDLPLKAADAAVIVEG
jgi:hypothetical protein